MLINFIVRSFKMFVWISVIMQNIINVLNNCDLSLLPEVQIALKYNIIKVELFKFFYFFGKIFSLKKLSFFTFGFEKLKYLVILYLNCWVW